MGFGHRRSCFDATFRSFLSRLVGFKILVVYRSLIDARYSHETTSSSGRVQTFSPGEYSLGGSDTFVSDIRQPHLHRGKSESSVSYSYLHPCAGVLFMSFYGLLFLHSDLFKVVSCFRIYLFHPYSIIILHERRNR